MAKEQYGIITSKKPEFPPVNLLRIPHKQGDLVVAHPAFGLNYFKNNVEEMQKNYSHPQTEERISFREPTTSESISAAAYDFKNMAKPQIFDPRWLQAGRILRTSEGVFANLPRDKQGNLITDEKVLKQFLKADKKINGIYFMDNDFGFAPHETFERGLQDCDTFIQGGLARILEHVQEKEAKNLKAIASPKFYKRGVHVLGFDEVKEPALRIVSLGSNGLLDCGRLGVGGLWDGYYVGFAFGVLKKSAEGASPKSR